MKYLSKKKMIINGDTVDAGVQVSLPEGVAARLMQKGAVAPMDSGSGNAAMLSGTPSTGLSYNMDNSADELDAIGILLGISKKDMAKAKTKAEKIAVLDTAGQEIPTDDHQDSEGAEPDGEKQNDAGQNPDNENNDGGEQEPPPSFNPAEDAQ